LRQTAAFQLLNSAAPVRALLPTAMSDENTIRARRLPDGTLVQVLPDGTTRPFPPDRTDWAALDAMTDEDVNAAALADPDNPPLTPQRQARLKRVPQVKVMRRDP
jgi:putative transcriptional regulator